MKPDALTFDMASSTPTRRQGPVPYLVIGLMWLAAAHVVATVKTLEPVYLWIMTQLLLLEKLPGSSRWTTELVWLAGYLAAGVSAWAVVEAPSRDPRRVWRRATLAWLAIQLGYSMLASLLVWLGILYE